jgi:hypothetical protein
MKYVVKGAISLCFVKRLNDLLYEARLTKLRPEYSVEECSKEHQLDEAGLLPTNVSLAFLDSSKLFLFNRCSFSRSNRLVELVTL